MTSLRVICSRANRLPQWRLMVPIVNGSVLRMEHGCYPADGETIISKFTVDNSPLLDNNIEHIDIDPVTGDVYFCTGKGLISYRGTATEGGTANEDKLYIYPNPVPTNYSGMIAIRGFAANSDVRITDIAGQLVYRTKANGGQAVWNGMDYTGHKAQSGVYLVFGVNKDGTQKITGKFILHR